ncbi:protein [Escherichia coli]|uniref:Protein n=1 Tax=Escherichia coli TaxID=562 RepID=A0A376ZM81_ECOLX|nr:protein [Escherichia coli]
MDDMQSLGVIYINHNFATESEARQALNEETDRRRNVLPRNSDAGTGE